MPRNNQFMNEDEALARALQEEYELEYRRRSLQQHLRESPSSRRPPPTAPTAPPPPTSFDEVYASVPPAFDPFDFDDEQQRIDEEYARQLELELRAQESENARRSSAARTSGRASSQSRGTVSAPNRGTSSRNMTLSNSGNYRQSGGAVVVGSRVLSDEEIARRLEQEERDAALAMSMTDRERTQYDREVAAAQTNRRPCCGLRRLGSCLVTLAMLAVAAGLLVYYFGGSDALPKFIPDPELFREEDPFSDANPEDANRWRNDGTGLELTMINALDEVWYDYFYQAVSDWDNGTPDSLDLNTKLNTAGSESVCRAMTGFIKVCNGNYGQTNWRGINKVLLENGWIYASSARMNEFYFSGEDEAQRQYTMCHEIGHGFGLPHTDENFYNADLGNCMDYTNRPENNMRPSSMNFDFLAQMYGSIDGSIRPGSLGDVIETSEAVPEDKNK